MVGINAIGGANYSSRNNNPSFGMALKMDPSANAVIKKQAVALGKKAQDSFMLGIDAVHERQLANPVDIILRKAKHRKALVAVIVDSPDGRELGAVKNEVISQPFFFKDGSLKFLDKAEARANSLNELNDKIDKLLEKIPEAKPEDYGKMVDKAAEDLAGEV